MWSKWPVLAVMPMLFACSVGGDELDAPLIGDCTSCTSGPGAGGGITGESDAGVDFDAEDVGVPSDAGNLDTIDLVDVGVPPPFDI
jgi:hypothetical protein